MKFKVEMDSTDNSRVYNITRKEYLARVGEISCSICPYHEHENASKKQRCWKKVRKTKHKM